MKLAAALMIILPVSAHATAPASSSSVSLGPALSATVAVGRKIAFDRKRGNCLACHVIAGGELPGNIGPELKQVRNLVPNRKELYAIIYDEQKRNAQTIMPAFGQNDILTPKQINDVIDFLYTK